MMVVRWLFLLLSFFLTISCTKKVQNFSKPQIPPDTEKITHPNTSSSSSNNSFCFIFFSIESENFLWPSSCSKVSDFNLARVFQSPITDYIGELSAKDLPHDINRSLADITSSSKNPPIFQKKRPNDLEEETTLTHQLDPAITTAFEKHLDSVVEKFEGIENADQAKKIKAIYGETGVFHMLGLKKYKELEYITDYPTFKKFLEATPSDLKEYAAKNKNLMDMRQQYQVALQTMQQIKNVPLQTKLNPLLTKLEDKIKQFDDYLEVRGILILHMNTHLLSKGIALKLGLPDIGVAVISRKISREGHIALVGDYAAKPPYLHVKSEFGTGLLPVDPAGSKNFTIFANGSNNAAEIEADSQRSLTVVLGDGSPGTVKVSRTTEIPIKSGGFIDYIEVTQETADGRHQGRWMRKSDWEALPDFQRPSLWYYHAQPRLHNEEGDTPLIATDDDLQAVMVIAQKQNINLITEVSPEPHFWINPELKPVFTELSASMPRWTGRVNSLFQHGPETHNLQHPQDQLEDYGTLGMPVSYSNGEISWIPKGSDSNPHEIYYEITKKKIRLNPEKVRYKPEQYIHLNFTPEDRENMASYFLTGWDNIAEKLAIFAKNNKLPNQEPYLPFFYKMKDLNYRKEFFKTYPQFFPEDFLKSQ